MRGRMCWVIGLASILMLGCLHAPMLWSPDSRWLAYTMAVRPESPNLPPGWIFETAPAGAKGAGWTHATARPPALAYRLWATRAETGVSVLLEESRGPITSPCWSP